MNKIYSYLSIFFFILLLGHSQYTHAQQYNLDWVNGIGKANNEAITSVAVDAAANVYSVGYMVDTLDFNPEGSPFLLPGVSVNQALAFESSAFIYKANPQGQLIWVKKFTGASGIGTNAQFGPSIATDSVGYLYIAGTFSGTVDFDPGSATHNLTANSAQDIFVVKLDSTGTFVWAKTIEGGATPPTEIAVTNDAAGNVYLSGQVGQDLDSIDFDPGPGIAKQETSYWMNSFILKWTSAGNYVWAKTICAIVYAKDIAVDRQGNVVVAGYYQDSADFDPGPNIHRLVANGPMDQNIFVLKLNTSGNFLWAKSIGGTGIDWGYSVAIDAWDNIYTTGCFGISMTGEMPVSDFDPGPGIYNFTTTGAPDVFISKLSGTGNFIWARSLGGTSFDMGYSITVSPEGKVYTAMSVAIADSSGMGTFDFDPGPAMFNRKGNIGEEYQGISILDTAGLLVWGGITGPSGSLPIGSNSHIVSDRNNDVYLGGAYAIPYSPQGGAVDFDPGPGETLVKYGGHDGNAGAGSGTDIFLLKLSPCVVKDTLDVQACNSYLFRGENYTLSGYYGDTTHIPGVCDSIITLKLSLGYSSSDTLKISRCDSFLFDTEIYKVSGNYSHRFATATGCDSTILLALNINGSTPDTAILQSGSTLTALAANVDYQWIDCNNGYIPVDGATEQSFKPKQNGSYALVARGIGGCSDTSYCYEVSGISNIAGLSIVNEVTIYPNPANGYITVKTTRTLQHATLKWLNILGQMTIQPARVSGNVFDLDMTSFAPGIYTLEITEARQTIRAKVIKK